MSNIGAKDTIDRALVRQYANVQTCNFDAESTVDPESMWKTIDLLSTTQKSYFVLMNNYKKVC